MTRTNVDERAQPKSEEGREGKREGGGETWVEEDEGRLTEGSGTGVSDEGAAFEGRPKDGGARGTGRAAREVGSRNQGTRGDARAREPG